MKTKIKKKSNIILKQSVVDSIFETTRDDINHYLLDTDLSVIAFGLGSKPARTNSGIEHEIYINFEVGVEDSEGNNILDSHPTLSKDIISSIVTQRNITNIITSKFEEAVQNTVDALPATTVAIRSDVESEFTSNGIHNHINYYCLFQERS